MSTEHTENCALHCFRAAGASSFNLTYRWGSQHIPACEARGTCLVLSTCAQGLAGPTHGRDREVHWVSFLGNGPPFVCLGLFFYFCVQVRTEQSVWRLRVSRGARTPLQRTPTNTITNTETRAHKNTNNTPKKTNTVRIKTEIRRKIKLNLQIQFFKTKNARNVNTPRNTNRGETFGPKTRRLFFVCEFVCANTTWSELRDKTMFGRYTRCRKALDPFSWRTRKCDSNARDADLCVAGGQAKGKRRRHSPAAVYANTELCG